MADKLPHDNTFECQKPSTDAQKGLFGIEGHPDKINSVSRSEEGRAPKQDQHIWQGPGLLSGAILLHSAESVADFNWLLTSHSKHGLAC